jgi:N-acetylglutamate synthase-like GNAT family acetyltransferase
MTDPRNAIRIRPATAADVQAITECVHAAYRHYVERIGKPPGPMLEDYAQVMQARDVSVAERAGTVLGVVVLDRTDEGFLLENVAVHPSSRGTGVGRLLLEFAEAEARRQGYPSIYLYTHQKMTENQVLYAKIGYVEYDRRSEKGYDRVYMRKRLA